MLIVPVTLSILLILFTLFNTVSRAVIVMFNVPVAVAGGVFAAISPTSTSAFRPASAL